MDEHARQRFAHATAAHTTADNALVAAQSDVIFLAVKPQQMAQVAAGLRERLSAKQLIVSIAAGVRLASLAEWLGPELRLVRVMPNTPCLVGQGASAYSLGEHATAEDGALVGRLLAALGSAWQVDEKLLDAVTGLAGSGPAFVYVMIEALSDAGVRMGLPRHDRHRDGGPHRPRRRRDGALHRRTSGRAERPRGQSRRHDNRRVAGVGVGRAARGADGRRRGRHAAVGGTGNQGLGIRLAAASTRRMSVGRQLAARR